MEERLEIILERYNYLNEELLKEEVYTDFNKMKTLSKEKTSLEEIINKYKEYKQAKEDLETAKEMLKESADEETINFANEEIGRVLPQNFRCYAVSYGELRCVSEKAASKKAKAAAHKAQ